MCRYKIDGVMCFSFKIFSCAAINKCFSENGGCSVHASCIHDASAVNVNCTCHDGYHGDGIVCLPVNICEENNGGCHPNASCRFRGPVSLLTNKKSWQICIFDLAYITFIRLLSLFGF